MFEGSRNIKEKTEKKIDFFSPFVSEVEIILNVVDIFCFTVCYDYFQ